MASSMGDAQSATVTATNAAASSAGPGTEVPPADVPAVEETPAPDGQGGDGAAGPPEPQRIEIDIADIPVGVAPSEAPVIDAPPAPVDPAPPAPEDPAAAAPDDDAAAQAAPPAAEEPAEARLADATYAGRTADRRMTVAIAVKDGRAVAYVCDGGKVEVWLSGSAADGGVALENKAGTSTMVGTLAGDELSGTVTLNGVDLEYSADETTLARAEQNGRDDVADVAERIGLVTP